MALKRIFLFLLFVQTITFKGQGQNADTIGGSLHKIKEDSLRLAAQLESLESTKKNGDKKSLSYAYYKTGFLYSESNDYQTAIEYYMLSLIICRETLDNMGMANCYQSMADAHKSLNHYAEAVRYYTDAVDLYSTLGYKNYVADCYLNISAIYEIKKNIAEAIKYTRNAQNIYLDKEKANACIARIKYLKAK